MALDRLVAGDTLDFTDEVPDYPPSAGWTLKYRLIPQFTSPVQAPIELTASTSGETYVIQSAPATTAAWKAGTYTWARWVEKTGARQTLDPLVPALTILDDPATAAAGLDTRTAARKILDGLLDLQASNAVSQGLISEYTIAGRSMRFRDTKDLLAQIRYWRSEVAREERAERLAAGQDVGGSLRVIL
jgi:hypothetical protein